MSFEFLLPDIGEGLSEAEIVRWLVAPGDSIREDAPFVEIQTDKAIVEMPSPATGTVLRLGGDVGEMIPVGALLIEIDGTSSSGPIAAPHGAGAPGATSSESASSAPASSESTSPSDPRPDGAVPPRTSRPRATPSTRGLARRLGVDLAEVTGTGPGGRITDADVQAALDAPSPAPTSISAPAPAPASTQSADQVAASREARNAVTVTPGERIPFRGIRRRTAETMSAAWQHVPHVSSFCEVDVTEAVALYRSIREIGAERGVKVTLTALLAKATALALARYPMMNASLDLEANEIVVHAERNVAVAVSTEAGLVLPVVRRADTAPVLDIARQLDEVTAAARGRSLDLASMSGSTFTISNYGPIGGWFGTSLVRNGEVGVLGFGPSMDKPWVRDGEIVVRSIMVVNAGADHRVVDGDDIIGFVTEVKRLLESPLELVVEGS
jgi:pyruvate dehydrogenase E2 component (dihydrolipoamide acetyltransferase)